MYWKNWLDWLANGQTLLQKKLSTPHFQSKRLHHSKWVCRENICKSNFHFSSCDLQYSSLSKILRKLLVNTTHCILPCMQLSCLTATMKKWTNHVSCRNHLWQRWKNLHLSIHNSIPCPRTNESGEFTANEASNHIIKTKNVFFSMEMMVSPQSRVERLHVVTFQFDVDNLVDVQNRLICVDGLEIRVDHPSDLSCPWNNAFLFVNIVHQWRP